MIINEVIGHYKGEDTNKKIDELPIEWHETNKRIQHLKSVSGEEVIIRFLRDSQHLHENDIVYEDDSRMIVVKIKPCKTIVLAPENNLVMASACYEIGNKHMSLYLEGNKILMPYEEPMYLWLKKNGYKPVVSEERLLHKLSANVEHHHH